MDKLRELSPPHRWLIATLAVAACYSGMALRAAFARPDLVQDDARLHVFWMVRFRDPTLFPNDLIADYFQAAAPAGYKALYWIFAKCGVEPLLLSKLLPAAIGLLTAYLAFRLFFRLTQNAYGAFFAGVILSQLLWFRDDVASATPRAFIYPLFLAFLLFLLERRIIACLVMLALEGLFYPQGALVSFGLLTLRLIKWQDRRPVFSRERADYLLAFGGMLVLAAVSIAFANSISAYGPVISRREAAMLPEFLRSARTEFFVSGSAFWLTKPRSGIWPGDVPPHIALLGVVGAVLLMCCGRFAAMRRWIESGAFLWPIPVAAAGLWATAHFFLFKLHLPARYSQWVFRILIALLAAVTVAIFVDAMKRWLAPPPQRNTRGIVFAVLSALTLLLIGYPAFARDSFNLMYVFARPRPLYDFLRSQPKDVVVATLSDSATKIPMFAQRSVLVSSEHAIPYHQGYYRIVRERGRDMIRAHLTSDPGALGSFIEKYHVDLIVIPPQPITTAYVKGRVWFRDIIEHSEPDQPTALSRFTDQCKVWEGSGYRVLDAHAIVKIIRVNEETTRP